MNRSAYRPWTPRTTRSGLEYGGSASQYYWDWPPNPGGQYFPNLDTYDYALPNCTVYCLGRMLENGDTSPITGWHNASEWWKYPNTSEGWYVTPLVNYADTIKPGDVLVFVNMNHVVTVESVAGSHQWYISESLYTDNNGGASGYRTGAVWGSTKQAVSDYGIANYPSRFFNYRLIDIDGADTWPDYILHNPNSPVPIGDFKFFMKKSKKRRRKVYV